ncbi:MAG: endonuclease/exonuclease/phosphatase family protein [Halobacteriales archaeon]|nr:endonuclease/exonuclease/phosphatase family protein [Halobacteriales archaeon]
MQLSRRDVLRAGGTVAAARVGTTDPLLATSTTVATQNLGLGVPLLDLLTQGRLDPALVGERFDQLRTSAVPARMAALAAELTAESPAIIGVQEGSFVERDGEQIVDFLDLLGRGFERASGRYRRVAVSPNADITLPATHDGERFDVRFHDRDALFVREDVAVEGTDAKQFAVNASRRLDGRRLVATRGFCRADCVVDGVPVVGISTHLSAADRRIRYVQAQALVNQLPDERALVVLADLNSRPLAQDPSAYSLLVEQLTDAAAAVGEPGLTCCRNPTLDDGGLGFRLDFVLIDGPTQPLATRLIAVDESSRIQAGDRRLWPSDHAGVVADLRVGVEPGRLGDIARALVVRLLGADPFA